MNETSPKISTASEPVKTFPLLEWLPEGIQHWIVEYWNHPEHVEGRGVIFKLACEPIMKSLWDELRKRHPNCYVYPANATFLLQYFSAKGGQDYPLNEATSYFENETQCQEVAFLVLFRQFLHIACYPGEAVTETELKTNALEIRQRADFLRMEAIDTERLRNGAGGVDWSSVANGMRAKADVLDQVAAILPVYKLTVKNNRPNRQGISAAVTITTMLKSLFSTPFYKLSAEIATMLTSEPVTFEQVRDQSKKQAPHVSFLGKKG